ncbi:MAG: DUF3604 domain-containing protein [Gammaproteobacteria bacterium TMED50]|nr:MAG: DUF3604 domain-containing protein [Gammaproteobacteria bacterium TMED50]
MSRTHCFHPATSLPTLKPGTAGPGTTTTGKGIPVAKIVCYRVDAAALKAQKAGEYARGASKRGLLIGAAVGTNPYRFGMIGATAALGNECLRVRCGVGTGKLARIALCRHEAQGGVCNHWPTNRGARVCRLVVRGQ